MSADTITNQDYKIFKSGDVITWHPNNFNSEFWDNLPEEDRIKYYGEFGYGTGKTKFFMFITDIYTKDAVAGERYSTGHSLIYDFQENKMIHMVHPTEFRLATDMEF